MKNHFVRKTPKLFVWVLIISIAVSGTSMTSYAAKSDKKISQTITEVKRGNTMGNLNNKGAMLENGGKCYFYYRGYEKQEASGMDPDGLTQEEMKTFRKAIDAKGTWWGEYWVVEPGIFAGKKDGSVKPLRITNQFQEKPKLYDAKFMNMVGNNLYYASTNRRDGQPNVICKVSVKGNAVSKQLFTCKDSNRDEIKKIAVMNNWIYYTLYKYDKGNKIYRMRLDGSDKTFITKTYNEYFDIDGVWLYYFNGTSIKRVNLINPKQTQNVVTTFSIVEDIIYDKGNLYFTYLDSVGTLPAKAGYSKNSIKLLTKGTLVSVENKKIYYSVEKQYKGKLYQMTLTGKSKKYIGEFNTGESQLIGGKVYLPSNIDNNNSSKLESMRYDKE